MKHIDNEGSNKGIPFPQLKGTNALHRTLNAIILFSASRPLYLTAFLSFYFLSDRRSLMKRKPP